MSDPQSCGQCECCEAWRAGRDRLTRERDEAREMNAWYRKRTTWLNGENDRLRALLRRIVENAHRRPNQDGTIQPREWAYQMVDTDLIVEAEAALEGRDE